MIWITHRMPVLRRLAASLLLALGLSGLGALGALGPVGATLAVPPAAAKSTVSPLLFTVTSAEAQVQGMALLLAKEAMSQGATVRVLLCGPAGDLALSGQRTPVLKPAGKTVQQLLEGVIAAGATVQVCGVYLPNTGHTAQDLIKGVAPAKPQAIAPILTAPRTRVLSF